jgi:hypothetical protein
MLVAATGCFCRLNCGGLFFAAVGSAVVECN